MMNGVAAQLRELAEPWPSGSKVKEAIERASHACGSDDKRRRVIPFWRAFDLWYGKARLIRDFEIEAVAAALEKKRREAARNELHELRTRLVRLESMLSQIDPDFHRDAIAASREQIRSLGRSGGGALGARDPRTLRFA